MFGLRRARAVICASSLARTPGAKSRDQWMPSMGGSPVCGFRFSGGLALRSDDSVEACPKAIPVAQTRRGRILSFMGLDISYWGWDTSAPGRSRGFEED